MAEPKPDSAKSAAPPALAAVPDPQAPHAARAPKQPERRGAPWWLFGLVVVMLGLSLWGLWGQTRHARAQAEQLAALNEQVVELETEVAILDGHLSAFGMQRDLVTASLDQLVQKLGDLQALVAWNPLDPDGPPPAASAQGSAGQSGEADVAAPEAPAAEPAEPSASAGPDGPAVEPGPIDLDAAPGLRPGPGLELAPRAGDDLRINGL